VEVCLQAFAKAHCRGHTYYDKMVRELKNGAVNGDTAKYSKHYAMKPAQIKAIMKNNTTGIKLSTGQFTAASLASTFLALSTAAWMKEFFALTGQSNFYKRINNFMTNEYTT
jgi:hypothetical protein